MKPLKTLKDLHRLNDESSFVELAVIKAEAIKWFKKGRIDICPRCERGKQSPCENCNISWQYRYGSFDFKDFFNITSEDLK